MASGCPSRTPSATMKGWLPTSLTRTAAGMDRAEGGERAGCRGLEEEEEEEEGGVMVQRLKDATGGTGFI